MPGLSGAPVSGMDGGRKTRRGGASVKALKKALKSHGLKTTGKKATLTRRAKKAHLKVGGAIEPPTPVVAPPPQGDDKPIKSDGGRKRSRKGLFKLY